MLKGLGICCLGSMRMILFFICMVAALGQLISLSIGLFSDPNKLNLGEDLDFGPTAIIGSLLFLIIFICGAYGTFNSHERSMRFVSIEVFIQKQLMKPSLLHSLTFILST